MNFFLRWFKRECNLFLSKSPALDFLRIIWERAWLKWSLLLQNLSGFLNRFIDVSLICRFIFPEHAVRIPHLWRGRRVRNIDFGLPSVQIQDHSVSMLLLPPVH
jgi:hypothetical protein